MRLPFALAILAGVAAALSSCRGSVSEEPPIHIIPDMDWQQKYEPQGESRFFADGRAMRPLVDGTVAMGHLKADDAFYRGTQNGQYLARLPLDKVERALKVDSLEKVMLRGRQRFDIYCAPCHDRTGNADGLVAQHANVLKPVLLTDKAPLEMSDGELFHYLSDGGGANMPGYAHQLPEADRWAIVAWVRVIQRSQHAQAADVPPGTTIEPAEAAP